MTKQEIIVELNKKLAVAQRGDNKSAWKQAAMYGKQLADMIERECEAPQQDEDPSPPTPEAPMSQQETDPPALDSTNGSEEFSRNDTPESD